MKHPFVHLHLHSEYSIVDGLVRIQALIDKCVDQKMPAVAMTDQSNLFAVVKFYRHAITRGIKPIIGAELTIQHEETQKGTFRSVLLCQNRQGYQNLTCLISKAYTHGQQSGIPIIKKEWIEEAADGLIMLSGGMHGDIGQAIFTERETVVKEKIKQWSRIFPNAYFLEVQRIGRPQEEEMIYKTVELAEDCGIPIVATNNVRFLSADDFEAHEARVCINDGTILNNSQRPQHYSEQQYLRTVDEMETLFADLPCALENSVEIAKRCSVELEFEKIFLPAFPIPDTSSIEDYLTREVRAGLDKRLAQQFDIQADDFLDKRKPYDDRLVMELSVINKMGYAGYFLIVADFIRWAIDNKIPVGPGRGSGAGSLVAYVLNITDLDPLQYDLLFERFLNPERISMPDFDIDFCMEGRDRVIEYVANRYGRESVSQIITFGTMAAKAVVRDVGRVLGYPYGFVDKIAKLIPFELGITLDKALRDEDALSERYEKEDDVKTLIDLAKKLEGLVRNAGKHAGGVVIAPSLLTDFMPLYCEAGSQQIVSQFDKDDVEAVGLVKFDFLGLRTLTIIDWALQTINEQRQKDGEEALDIRQISMEDDMAFKLLRSCRTMGVFQLESRGMRDLIKRLKPDCFEDIVALMALFRPGPLQSGMVDDFVDRKHGRAVIKYLHPRLENILCSTYGVILYQEQVMQIAQELAGYTLGGADVLRRAMGKKKPAEMAKQRVIFLKGAVENGVKVAIATQIFDLMEKFAGYGFNKSHSVAYACVSFQTAWLKAHYPAAFMAAVLSSEMDHTDKVVRFIDECRDIKLTVLKPDINKSQYAFTVCDDKTISYGLGAIKGVGESAIENTVNIREEEGLFKDLFDFCTRVNLKKVNRRVLEALTNSGAFDCFGKHRASLFASVEKALRFAEQAARDLQSGQGDLFGQLQQNQETETNENYVEVQEWSDEERLRGEKETLGLYFSGHPIQRYEAELNQFVTASLGKLSFKKSQTIIVAGFVSAIRTLLTKRNERMAFLTLSDRSGRLEFSVFADLYALHRDLLNKDQMIVVEIEVNYDDVAKAHKLNANKIVSMDKARALYAKCILVHLAKTNLDNNQITQLKKIIEPFRHGDCPVVIQYQGQESKANIQFPQEWWVHPTDELLNHLGELLGKTSVRVCY